jgi:hypothetical protein
MKIYLAATGPNNETFRKNGMLPILKRLLSYHHIQQKQWDAEKVFIAIRKLKEENENEN